MSKYQCGEMALFVDEGGCEIKGQIINREDRESILHLRIKLDADGYYNAKLLKRDYVVTTLFKTGE